MGAASLGAGKKVQRRKLLPTPWLSKEYAHMKNVDNSLEKHIDANIIITGIMVAMN
jgi:hypothetical protein